MKLYKEPYLVFSDFHMNSLYCATTKCSGKCKENNPNVVCQNEDIKKHKDDYKNYSGKDLLSIAKNNSFCEAILFSGLDPIDDYDNLVGIIREIRNIDKEYPIVIYTGYAEDEIQKEIKELKTLNNIWLKVGRYIPNRESIIDRITGVKLISDNQYFIKL